MHLRLWILVSVSLISMATAQTIKINHNNDSLIKNHILPVITLGLIQASVAYLDGSTTMYGNEKSINGIKQRICEKDPISKFFIGQHPTWRKMIMWGSIETISAAYLSYQMKNSTNVVIKKLWWVPQTFFITLHGGCSFFNIQYNKQFR